MRLVMLFLLVLISTGCTHHQLRFGTIRQADTLNDVFTRQVLDNLAQFSVEPHALPHFAIPNQGSNAVSDSGTVGGLALDAFRSSAAFGGSRGHTESWVLEPIRDPDKLRRMQCAYQQVFGVCDDLCTDCCSLEKQILGAGTRKVHVFDVEHQSAVLDGAGNPITDPLTNEPYVSDFGQPFPNPRNQNGKPYTYDAATGCVTVPAHDCDGPCSIGCGWVQKGCSWYTPFARRDYTGCYRGTTIWVAPEHREKLSKLVLRILDYALKDPSPSRTKEVVVYVGENGEKVVEKSKAFGKVTATLPVGTPNLAILQLSKCNSLAQKVIDDKINAVEDQADQVQREIAALRANRAKQADFLNAFVVSGMVEEDIENIKTLANNFDLNSFKEQMITRANSDNPNELSGQFERLFQSIQSINSIDTQLKEQADIQEMLDQQRKNFLRQGRPNIEIPPLPASRSNFNLGGTILRVNQLLDALSQ